MKVQKQGFAFLIAMFIDAFLKRARCKRELPPEQFDLAVLTNQKTAFLGGHV